MAASRRSEYTSVVTVNSATDSARRMPLPTVLPLRMQQAAISVIAYGDIVGKGSFGMYGLRSSAGGKGVTAEPATSEEAISEAQAFVAQRKQKTVMRCTSGIKGLTRDRFKLISALPPPIRGAPWTAAESATMKAQQALLRGEYVALCAQAITRVAQTVVLSLPSALQAAGISHPLCAYVG